MGPYQKATSTGVRWGGVTSDFYADIIKIIKVAGVLTFIDTRWKRKVLLDLAIVPAELTYRILRGFIFRKATICCVADGTANALTVGAGQFKIEDLKDCAVKFIFWRSNQLR